MFGNIAAILSKVDLRPWTEMAGQYNLQRLGELIPRIWRHERVIEQVMRYSPVLPARFLSLFSSLEAIERFINCHYDEISEFLRRIAGKEEWSCKGYLNRAKAEESLISSACNQKSLPGTPGAAYLSRQRLRAKASRELGGWAEERAKEVAARLQEVAIASRPLSNRFKEASPNGSDMFFHWAFLVRQEDRERLRECIERLNAACEGKGVVFEAAGPLPPYSFCPDLKDSGEQTTSAGAQK
jgi:hypothetical protein